MHFRHPLLGDIFCHHSCLTNLLWFPSAETADPARWVFRGSLHSQECTWCLSHEQFHGPPYRCGWHPGKPSYPVMARKKIFSVVMNLKRKYLIRAGFLSPVPQKPGKEVHSFLFDFCNVWSFITWLVWFSTKLEENCSFFTHSWGIKKLISRPS